jgi:hypothetical protein
MAGIEKVCEFSGEHGGWEMYGYKRNQLQILPEYRKLFRGAGHTLYIKFDSLRWQFNWGGYMDYCPENEYFKFRMRGRVVKEYWYELEVKSPELQGRVKGLYSNRTLHLPTVKRKLKRLLRCKKLNIVEV